MSGIGPQYQGVVAQCVKALRDRTLAVQSDMSACGDLGLETCDRHGATQSSQLVPGLRCQGTLQHSVAHVRQSFFNLHVLFWPSF